MKRFTQIPIFVSILFFSSHLVKAETYFLKIQQVNIKNQEIFLQTCSVETSPCTFMMPITLGKASPNFLLVTMNFKELSHYAYLKFYWNQKILTTNHFGENFYAFMPATSNSEIEERMISLYHPLINDRNEPALRGEEAPFISLRVQAVKLQDSKVHEDFFFNN